MTGRERIAIKNIAPKLGRNDLCSCGSGLKFKKCCLGKAELAGQRVMASKDGRVWEEAPPALRTKAMRMFAEKERKEQERVARFGQVRPQISTVVWQGDRTVAVRDRIYRSGKWKFFADFLRDYVPAVLGMDWCKAEAAKDPYLQMYPLSPDARAIVTHFHRVASVYLQ